MILQQGNFNPEMLTLARKSRRMTQGQLAKEAGITQAAISKYEAGLQEVDEELMPRIANALDYPTQFFSQAMAIKGPGVSEYFHRKRARMSVSLLNQVYTLAEIRRLEVFKLLASWEADYPPVPFLPIEEYEEDPPKIARTVRAVWQVPLGPIFNLTRTLEQNGCIIVGHDFGTRAIDGFSYRSTNMPPVFHLNTGLPPDRWRWTLAHELGHLIMHNGLGETEVSPKEAEQQADVFAGEFLAPEHELKPSLWNLDFQRLAGLKLQWKISMQALVMQAFRVGAINSQQRQSLFVRMSKAGYRQREPENLDPPIETASWPFNLVKFHMIELQYTREEIKDYLAIGEPDFRRYYHDPFDYLEPSI